MIVFTGLCCDYYYYYYYLNTCGEVGMIWGVRLVSILIIREYLPNHVEE